MFNQPVRFGFGSSLTPMVRNLLFINGMVYLLQLLTSATNPIENRLALWPEQVINHLALWQLVTYMFLHGSIFHILFNLFTLWMFGCDVERSMGSRRFIGYYLITGVGAALFHMAFSWNSANPVLGASGAIYGVLVAFAVLFPNREITLLLFFILPMQLKAKYLAIIFMTVSLLAGVQGVMTSTSGGVAHLAHLGGGLVGFVLLFGTRRLQEVAFEFRKRMQWRNVARQNRKAAKIKIHQLQIDQLLDKINLVGYDNLSVQEKALLKKTAEHLSNEK
jgi:membrane associated rhomboid family serine protease